MKKSDFFKIKTSYTIGQILRQHTQTARGAEIGRKGVFCKGLTLTPKAPTYYSFFQQKAHLEFKLNRPAAL